MPVDPADRERSLELLNSVHSFPGPFQFRVVVNPGHAEPVVAAMCAACSHEDPVVDRTDRPSRKGTYLSVKLTLSVVRAEEVLEVYASLREVEGVVTVF